MAKVTLMVSFYKHDIPAWMDGTERLTDGAYRAYHVICQLIYLNEGPIAFNERGLAGRCNQRIIDFRRYLNELKDAKKVSVEDSRIFNGRAATELARIVGNRVNAGEGGRISGRTRRAKEGKAEQGVPSPDPEVPSSDPVVPSIENTLAEPSNGSGRGAEGVPEGSGSIPEAMQTGYGNGAAHVWPEDNPLKIHDPPEAPLREDRSLKEKRREEKTREDSPPTSPDPEVAVGLRVGVAQAFEKANIGICPDTSQVEVWLAQGFDAELCLAVVRSCLSQNRDIKGLKYFEPAIKRAHLERAPKVEGKPDDTEERRVDLPGSLPSNPKTWPVTSVRMVLAAWKKDPSLWMDILGNRPGTPGCIIPQDLIDEVAS